MSHRTILATAATLSFLNSQPGEFTAQEIRNLGTGFHCDNDSEDVSAICEQLSYHGFVRRIEDDSYVAYSRIR